MAKVETYRKLLQEILSDYGNLLNRANDEVEIQTVFDTVHDHYQLVQVGFRGNQRRYGCLFHADIKNEKIWIQHDSTDLGIGNELLEHSVPKQDIVLGYYTPVMRKFSEFAIA